MDIYLVRHTKPAIAAGICYGQTDLDVCETFADELSLVRQKLANIEKPVIYSSPLQRCLKLAHAISSTFNSDQPLEDARLKELNFGDWEMQAWDEIPQGLIEVWAEDHVLKSPPNGESFHELSLRVSEFLDEVSRLHQAPLIVCTHAGVIRALAGYALGLSLVNTFRLEIDYASVTKIVVEPHLTKVSFINR